MSKQPEWMPTALKADLVARAKLIQAIRHFFIESGYLEVETPSLGYYGVTDCYLSNLRVQSQFGSYFLQTSPEYYMKRLLAADSGPIFQIGKAFRDEELGRWHQPEFTMLEFYQLDINHYQLMAILSQLFVQVCQWPEMKRFTYQQLFEQYCGFNPHQVHLSELKACVNQFNLQSTLDPHEADHDQYLFLLLSGVIEPALSKYQEPVAVVDFPQSQSALARVEDGIAQRFEIYFRGVELANGFHELSDVAEQRRRFRRDNEQRREQEKSEQRIDPAFLAALQHGLPNCSGVAVGIDRLVALCLGHDEIQTVMSFAL